MQLTLRLLITVLLCLALASCGNQSGSGSVEHKDPGAADERTEEGKRSPAYAITEVELTNPLDQEMVAEGLKISEMKCFSCHKTTDERLVGPGWGGITKKREPEWIMNMITNVDMMLAEDPEAQKLLEECLVRMPNQNIKVSEARSILEYMRHNDGEQ